MAAGTPLGNITGIGTLGNVSKSTDFAGGFTAVLSQILGVLTVVGALWFVFQIFLGALNWIGAGHDKQSLDNAKKKITNALIGLTIIVAAYSFIGVVGYFFGIDILNLKAVITNLPK